MPDLERAGSTESSGLSGCFFSSMQLPDRNHTLKSSTLLSTNFLLPNAFREAVENHEPDYHLIWKLDYSSLCQDLPSGILEPTPAMIREKMPPLVLHGDITFNTI